MPLVLCSQFLQSAGKIGCDVACHSRLSENRRQWLARRVGPPAVTKDGLKIYRASRFRWCWKRPRIASRRRRLNEATASARFHPSCSAISEDPQGIELSWWLKLAAKASKTPKSRGQMCFSRTKATTSAAPTRSSITKSLRRSDQLSMA